MDWDAAIEKNRAALKLVLAALIAMAALPDLSAGGRATLPRRLHRAVLRLLRPAEAAVRRLVIVAARGLEVTLPRERRPEPKSSILRNGVGTGIVMPAGYRASADPPAPHRLPLSVTDPLRRLPSHRRPVSRGVPRIGLPGLTARSPVPLRRAADDPVDATRLGQRLAALGRALDDLPSHARRFARWRARRDAGRIRRPSHEVHDILNVVHDLAFWALESPDTS